MRRENALAIRNHKTQYRRRTASATIIRKVGLLSLLNKVVFLLIKQDLPVTLKLSEFTGGGKDSQFSRYDILLVFVFN